MSDQHKPYLRHGPTVVSLVAALTCAFASDASARPPSVAARVDNEQLAARIGSIVEQIRLHKPTLIRDLPPDAKIAQWRNR
jgi:hypothetical protein